MAMLPTQTPSPTATAVPTPATEVQASESHLAEAAWRHLEFLSTEYSPRESSSAEEAAAAEYLLGWFTELGYETRLQEFTVVQTRSEVSIGDERIDSIQLSQSASGSAVATLTNAGRAFPQDIPQTGLVGEIALIERGRITFEDKVKEVASAGAVAAIVYNIEPGLFRGDLRNPSSIPAVAVSREDGLRLKSMIGDGDVTASVSVEERMLPSRNVVATSPGGPGDHGTVIVGAHYDTTPDTEGANDNGSGVATLMTILEQIENRSFPFDLTFILFGSEEVGLFGSRHYVEEMTGSEIGETIAMMNLDVVGSGTTLEAIGNGDLTAAAARIGSETGIPVKVSPSLDPAWSSDHAPFQNAGIPVIFLLSDDLSRINSPQDELQFVEPHLLGWSAEVGIALLDWLAERSEP